MATLTKEIIEAAITGFEAQKQHLDEQLAELRAMLSSASAGAASTSQPRGRKRRGMSEAGRKAIAEAQRQRWAAVRGESVPQKSAPKPKRKLSAAGRAAIVAALKKRWAAKKAASTGETQATKKSTGRKKVA
jgi:hypothetical protein